MHEVFPCLNHLIKLIKQGVYMRKKLYKDIFDIAIVASIYVVLTIVIQPLAYGELQFRLSEVLMLMVFFNKKYATSMIIGCLIANLWSPYLLWDMMFGTLATALACLFISKSKHYHEYSHYKKCRENKHRKNKLLIPKNSL